MIRIVQEPRHIYRCVSCGETFAPVLMTPDFFQKWNQGYIDAGIKMRNDTEKLVVEHLGLN